MNRPANGDANQQHSLPHADEARPNATAFGVIDHAKESGLDEENGRADGVYKVSDHNEEEVEEDEDAPINPTKANKEKRKQRHVMSYCVAVLRHSALSIAVAAVLVGIFFLVREIIYVIKLKNDNIAMSDQIEAMSDQIALLKKGIINSRGPFKPEDLKCDQDLNELMGGASGDSIAPASERDPNLPGFSSCVSNDAAGTLLEAQARVQRWSSAEAPNLGQTPEWIKRRVPDYGIWLYPRLKLVLFSCPKCGNSESRTMLTVLSSMSQQNPVDSKAKVENVVNWTVPEGAWTQESTDSWRLSGTFKGAGGTGMSGGDKATVDAFDLVKQLLNGIGDGNGGKWNSLSIVRHPYERFVDAYAELEALWARLPASAPERKVLDARPFGKMTVGSWERCQAFFADYVMGHLSVKDGTSQCLVSSLPELYSLVPTAAGYLRTGTGSGAYFNADRIISIDQIHDVWPGLLSRWGFDPDDDQLVELADVHLNAGAGSDAAKAARDLLASDEEFRISFDAFYAQDFSCFGFQRGQEVLGVEAKEKPTKMPTMQPTVQPTKIPTTQPTVQPPKMPTTQPTKMPTMQPTTQPTKNPTAVPPR